MWQQVRLGHTAADAEHAGELVNALHVQCNCLLFCFVVIITMKQNPIESVNWVLCSIALQAPTCTAALDHDSVTGLPASRWRASLRSQRLAPILLACGINPAQPGEYSITFSVTSSSGLSASASRKLVIKAACAEGEKLCSDQVGYAGGQVVPSLYCLAAYDANAAGQQKQQHWRIL